jgi:serine/threonine protein kinase
MPPRLAFLAAVACAAVRHCGNLAGAAAGLPLPLGEIAAEVMEAWAKGRREADRRAEVEEVARAAVGEVAAEVRRLLAELAADLPAAGRAAVEGYLVEVPAAVRTALRRPADPTGTTMPAGFSLRSADDVVALLPARPPRFRPGDRPAGLGDWELVERLGAGGYGEVWKARNPHFDGVPPVALKFCTAPGARDRLLRHEAGVLNRVMRHGTHPGIARLEHTYLAADPPCLAYEYVEGGDLAGLVRDWRGGGTPLSPDEAAGVVLRLAEAVGFAHRLSPPVVHRDLKPANVLVRPRPLGGHEFKVTDFGIGGLAAGAADAAAKAGTGATSAALLGACTPLYASPQQLDGGPPDPRDDVYALGVIWHQLLTGDLTRGRPGGVAWQRRLADGGVGGASIELLASCLEDEPADRPADAAVLADHLRVLIRGESGEAAPSPAPEAARVRGAPGRDVDQGEATPSYMPDDSPSTWWVGPTDVAFAPATGVRAWVRRRVWGAVAGGLLAGTVAGGAAMVVTATGSRWGHSPGPSIGDLALLYTALGAAAGAVMGSSRAGWLTVGASVLGTATIGGAIDGPLGAATGAAAGLLIGLALGASWAVLDTVRSWGWVRSAFGRPDEYV